MPVTRSTVDYCLAITGFHHKSAREWGIGMLKSDGVQPCERSALTLQVGPLTRQDETGPVVRMIARLEAQHLKLDSPQRLASAHILHQRLVVPGHQVTRTAVRDGPQTHQLAFGAGEEQ